jgi:Ser/Thr protein kinase RdoA (MazF antagonist)
MDELMSVSTHASDVALEEHFAAVLSQLQLRGRELFGSDTINAEVDAVLVRPFSRVYKLRLNGESRFPNVFVKIARPRLDTPEEFEFMSRRVAKDFQTTRSVHEAMSGCEGLNVVRAIACFPEHLALLTEAAPGDTLGAYVEREARWWGPGKKRAVFEVARRAGEWIRAFQKTGGGRQIQAEEIRDYIDLRLRRLTAAPRAHFSESDRRDVLAALARQRIADADLTSVAVHADLALSNILVDRGRITVLDLAMAGGGTRFHDLTHLYMQMALLAMKPSFRPATVAALQRGLVRGYDAGLSPDEPLFRVMYLQHRVCHLVAVVESRRNLVQRLYDERIVRSHRKWIRWFCAS